MSDHDHDHEHKEKKHKEKKHKDSESTSPAASPVTVPTTTTATPPSSPPKQSSQLALTASGGLSSSAGASAEAGKVVRFNVGGVRFQTTQATLTRTLSVGEQPSKFFAEVAAGKGAAVAVRDENGDAFIDRDPTLFSPILEYLRTGRFHAPPALLDAVYREGAFYGVHLPTGKIFSKENEFHTEVVSVPITAKPEHIQHVINDKVQLLLFLLKKKFPSLFLLLNQFHTGNTWFYFHSSSFCQERDRSVF